MCTRLIFELHDKPDGMKLETVFVHKDRKVQMQTQAYRSSGRESQRDLQKILRYNFQCLRGYNQLWNDLFYLEKKNLDA